METKQKENVNHFILVDVCHQPPFWLDGGGVRGYCAILSNQLHDAACTASERLSAGPRKPRVVLIRLGFGHLAG